MKSLTAVFVLSLAGCSSNNLFLGEVRATVGTHAVTVTDCYRFRVDPPRQTADGTYEFTPCRDARITISREELTVNGTSYGPLKPNDRVLVDHGVVTVQRAG